MNFSRIRAVVIAVIFIVFSAGVVTSITTGTLCGFAIGDIAILCPLGALFSMIASRTLIPRSIIAIVIALVAIFLLGRFICGWVCPVSLWRKIASFFKPKKAAQLEQEEKAKTSKQIAEYEISKALGHDCSSCGMCSKQQHTALDSRHAVLGGTLLATAIFGFPVFCLVCPVGLSFATIVLLVGLFGAGNLNIGILFAPAFLIIEVLVLKKWCTRFCPISALINLVARFSKTGMPQIDNSVCLESSKGIACSQCATVCKYDVNLRHPEYGELPALDCARCMECVSVCPTRAISISLVNKKSDGTFAVELPAASGE